MTTLNRQSAIRKPQQSTFYANIKQSVSEWLSNYSRPLCTTYYYLILLDDEQNKVYEELVFTRGIGSQHTPNACREVVNRAALYGAAQALLVQHRWIQDITPSSSDIEVSRQMVSALGLLDCRFIDHLIYSSTNFPGYSLNENGDMQECTGQ